MKCITIYYGPKTEYEKIIPINKKTLAEIVSLHDDRMNTHLLVVKQDGKQKIEDNEIEKAYIENVVAYSESYAAITESAIQSFLTIINEFNIDNLYLQNPPKQIIVQLEQTYPDIINIEKYKYKDLTGRMFKELSIQFNTKIIGQEKVKKHLLVALYPLLNRKEDNDKPIVIMFYGDSGVGKTETAKLISSILGQKLFRKQFSMFQSIEFSNYLFGGKHSQDSFARDLLERESNVILIDEFDKPASVFHSAFYQLFDEGIFEDKNYKVELKNSIIICTSNYKNIDEIREKLGDPIFYRFNNVIRFEKLSIDSLKKIADMLIKKKYNELTKTEQKNIDLESIRQNIYKIIEKLDNVRNIDKIIQEMIGIQLVEAYLNNKN